MKFLKIDKKVLKLSMLGLLFASSAYGMRVDHIDMNTYSSAKVQKNDIYIAWTSELQGCVTTIIDLEYADGSHAICMGHFRYKETDQNRLMIENFLSSQNFELKNIKRASCILIPPGIYNELIPNTKEIVPIFDPAWKEMIIATIKRYLPDASIVIKPYLFNKLKSGVRYSYKTGDIALDIVNGSSNMDFENKDLLFETHHYGPRWKSATFSTIIKSKENEIRNDENRWRVTASALITLVLAFGFYSLAK